MNSAHQIPSLDIFTVKVMTLITVLVVSLSTLASWRINQRMAGMRAFSLGLLSIAFGSLLGLARVVVPGSWILLVCNIFMVGGILSVAQGIRVFRSFRPLPLSFLLFSFTAAASSFFYWLYVQDIFARRVGIVSVLFSLLCLDAAISMFRQVPARDRTIYWPAGVAFAFASFYLAVRATGAFSGWYGPSLLSPAPLELATTICADIAYIACAFGMLLASNRKLRNESEELASFDPLTNLPNRRLFLDRLLDAELRSQTTGCSFGVVYLDLDGFKAINDTLGHATGDELLRRVGAAMGSVLRAGDCLARLGGDEFVVLIEGVAERGEVEALAARLAQTVESEATLGPADPPIRISHGIAIFPENGVSAHDVMREADLAMYHSKRLRRKSGTAHPADQDAWVARAR